MTVDLGKLTAARLWVISEPTQSQGTDDAPRGQAYLSHALFSLVSVPTDDVARMAVDESWRLYVNPEWLAATEVPEVGRELVHVLWHLLGEHAVRARASRVTAETADRWRVAADMAIRDLTRGARLYPEHLPRPLTDRRGRCPSLEEMYAALADLLPADGTERTHTDCGSGADGLRRDYEPEPGTDLPEVTEFQARALARHVAQAIEAGDGPGHGTGALKRWARGVTEPRVPWRQVLAGAIRQSATTVAGLGDYTYRRPSRRSASTPRILLPSQHRPVPNVAVVVNTSGSMDETALGRVLTELDNILATLHMVENGIQVFTVDTVAYQTSHVRRATDISLLGGGGTDMRIGIAAAAAQRPRPELTVVFTDGFTPWPDKAVPGMTVIAALIGDDRARLPATPEWMVRVECLDDE